MSSETDPHFEEVSGLTPSGETFLSVPIRTSATQKIARNRFAFGLLTLIVLVSAMYGLRVKYKQYVHAESVSALQAAGLEIHDDGRMLTIIDPSRQHVTNECLFHVSGLDGRVRVDFTNCRQITDEGLEHLRGNSSICALRLGRTGITDAGMRHLSSISSLEALDVSHTGISDAGLTHFSKSDLDKLQDLNLGATKVTNKGLENLGNMDGLRFVVVEGTQVTGDGVEKLREVLPEVIFFGVK